jgi:hypothetical protein
MTVTVDDIDTLKTYISGVMERADHHANNVSAVALALAGAIVWRKDADSIRVMDQGGDMKNVLWVKIGGQRYAFSYKHQNASIEMRRGTTHGDVLHSFDNATPLARVEQIFRDL